MTNGGYGAVQSAVHRIRSDNRYLRHARRLEAAFAQCDGIAEITALVDEVVCERARKAQSESPMSACTDPVGRPTRRL